MARRAASKARSGAKPRAAAAAELERFLKNNSGIRHIDAFLPDMNGNGSPEMAVLGVHEAGYILAQIRDIQTGLLINNVFFNQHFPPQDFAVVPDISGNSVPELGVLGRHEIGYVLMQLRDASTGSVVSNVWFNEE